MSALQFLNKKSWHPSKKDNSEKLWLKEQQAAKERARIAELQKQLEEERKIEEIQRLEIESGRLDPVEIQKRKRLNWMYEYGPNEIPAAAKAKEDKQKEQEQMLLGNKEVDLDKLAKQRIQDQGPTANLFLDAEAKLREDPLLEMKRQRAFMLQSAAKHSTTLRKRPSAISDTVDGEKEAKRRRKEQRKEIRNQRKRRREERSQKKAHPSLNSSIASAHSRPTNHVTPMDVQNTSKHHRRDSSAHEAPRASSHTAAKYGLQIPTGGTGVAVEAEFVPRNLPEVRPAERRNSRRLHGRPPLPPRGETAEDRRQKVAEMRRDAESLEEERIRRIANYLQMEQKERVREEELRGMDKSENCRQRPAHSFARETMERAGSTADHVRRRRAWSTRDDNAAY